MSVPRLGRVALRLVISAEQTRLVVIGLRILPVMQRKVGASLELLILPLVIDLVLLLRRCGILQRQFVKSSKVMRSISVELRISLFMLWRPWSV